MAPKAKPTETPPPKRLNRVVGAGEALQKALDPVFRKRGFATRDIVTHWGAMAPAPYDKAAAPDRLVWPRSERNAGGATLYLRCAPGHALALQHEGALIAGAINRYFGYLLVASVRLSAAPFVAASAPAEPRQAPPPHPGSDAHVEGVADEGVRDALRRLGRGIMAKSRRS